MSETLKITRISWDMDGVLVPAPFSLWTTIDLALRRFHTKPDVKPVLKDFHAPKGFWKRKWAEQDYRGHAKRKATEESINAVKRLVGLRKELGLDFEIGVLSGRDPSKHDLAERVLDESGLRPHFSFVLLNPGYRSPVWKEMNAKGEGHFHFEDDPDPAVRMARNGTHVYLVDNPSTDPRLLRWGGVILPPNVIPVGNITKGMDDLEQRLRR